MSELHNRTLDYFNGESKYHHQKFHIENPNNQKDLEDLVLPLLGEITHPLLEVGCGVGDSGLLYSPDFAVDFSSSMVEEAKKLLVNTEFKVANATDLPFDNNSFSTVVSVAMLQHTLDPSMAVSEMVRVAKDKVIIVTNHVEQYITVETPFMVHHFSEESLNEIIGKNIMECYSVSISIMQDKFSIIRIEK